MAGSRSQGSELLLRKIDAAVDRMRAVTPDEPYVLSIPQDEPKYHHHSRHSADLWLHRTPFHRDDHPNQQYQTFYYHEPLSDVFHLHRNSFYQQESHVSTKDRSRDKANAVSSSQSTPSMAPKKKISLAAYANKKAQPDKTDEKAEPKTSSPSLSLKSRDSANLPRMLSPLHMPKRDQNQHQPLLPPRLLSPTLPASIIASLDAHPYHPQERRSRPKSASKRLPSPNPPPPPPAPVDKAHRDAPIKPPVESRDTPQQREDNDQEDDVTSSPSLTVCLKIPKSMRKTVVRYLQTKPQKTIRDPRPEKPPPVSATKRPRAAEDDTDLPESKRKKTIKAEPSTPAPVTPAAQKETPTARTTKELQTSTLRRVASTDSMVNGTPTGPTSRQVNGTTKPSPSSGHTKTAETQAWEVESARIGKIGRDLKHSASANAQKKSQGDMQLAAVQSLESFLCFILSFYCTERGLASRNPPAPPEPGRTWLTLPAFVKFVRVHCHEFPHLEGLVCHLGVVCNAMILSSLTSRSQRPQEMTREDTRAIHDAAVSALKSSREGAAKLPLASLITEFPKTWKKSMDAGSSSDEDIKPGRYAGALTLPLGLESEPLGAVRVGHAMLAEWCAQRGMGSHKLKLSLNS